jgi:hypothetical protein
MQHVVLLRLERVEIFRHRLGVRLGIAEKVYDETLAEFVGVRVLVQLRVGKAAREADHRQPLVLRVGLEELQA